MNFVNPVHNLRSVSIHINATHPVSCVVSDHVKVLQWNWECFFFRHKQGGRLALSLLRFGPLFPCVGGTFLCMKMYFLENRTAEKGRPKAEKCSCLLWAIFDRKCHPPCTFHIDTQHRLVTPIDAPQPDLFQNTSGCKDGPVRTGTPCHRKNGNRWHGQQEDRDHAGPDALNNEAVVAAAPHEGRDSVAERWATAWYGGSCVSSFPCISRRTARDVCVFPVGLIVKSLIKTLGLPPCRAVQSPVFANVCEQGMGPQAEGLRCRHRLFF